MSMPSPQPAAARPRFAFPARLVVFLVFMTQFIGLLVGLGIYVPTLHEGGVSTPILVIGSVAAFALFQVGLGWLLRFLPVRCGNCGDRAYFAGFGWWPFIYRFACPQCGTVQRHEIRGQ